MTFDDLQTLIDYHYWARDRTLQALEPLTSDQFTKDLGNSFPSIRDTLVHLYGADWIWCARWEGQSPDQMPDPSGFADLESIRTAWSDQEASVRRMLKQLGDRGVEQPIEYVRNGVRQSQPFWQMLQHLVNHGSYHRGQIVTMLRQLGAEVPPSTDLIAYFRERARSAG